MIVNNYTNYSFPEKFCQKIMDKLGVNPIIEIYYENKNNFINLQSGKKIEVFAYASDYNIIVIYLEANSNGVVKWTKKYFKWILCHELKHQYFFYHKGNRFDPFADVKKRDIDAKEERACNNFANKMVGRPEKDFSMYLKRFRK